MEDKRKATIRIGDRLIGSDQPTYIIAEIGINHNGKPELAKKLIEVAAEAKADAVKFQKRHLPSLYPTEVLMETDKYEQYFQYMIPILQNVELSPQDLTKLKGYAIARGLEFLCTPFDIPSVDSLAELGVNAFKIASADLTNLELLEYIASYGKTMLISTGMSYWGEIEKAAGLLKGKDIPFALLHCRSVYPVWPREVNLRMISRLKEFCCPVGYSGHDIGITIPLVAASMGACIIEKHITLDKTMAGPDHKISLEPHEVKRLVRDIRVADQAMGKTKRFLLRGEILNREVFGKSLIAAVDIEKGARISPEMVKTQGPGKGLSPSRRDELIGKVLSRNVKKGDFFLEEDVDGSSLLDFQNTFRTRWGLISRFADMEEILAYRPKVIEFHLAEKDFGLAPRLNGGNSQELIVHVPEYIGERLFDLCSLEEPVRVASVELVKRTIDLTRDMALHFNGEPKIIVHPGAMSLNTKLDKKALRQSLVRSLDEVGDGEVEILLENLPPYPWYFGGQWKGNYFMDADEIRSFCEQYNIRVCFDLSHAALYCNAGETSLCSFVEKVIPFIGHIHFADAYGLDGEGVAIGEGDIDFGSVMPLFADYEGSWVPEIWRGHLHGCRGFVRALNKLAQYAL